MQKLVLAFALIALLSYAVADKTVYYEEKFEGKSNSIDYWLGIDLLIDR